MKNLKLKMKKEKAKSTNPKLRERGITLIALVVTIVVLLILAGISISIVLGEGGIIDSARRAGELTNAAIANEQQMLQNVVDWVDEYLGGNGGKNTEEGGTPKPEPEGTITIIYDDNNWEQLKTVTIEIDNGKEIEYIEGDGEKWQDYSEALTITKNNTIIYAREKGRTTSKEEATQKTIGKIDTEKPTEITVTVPEEKITDTSITVQAIATDATEASGLSGIHEMYFSYQTGEEDWSQEQKMEETTKEKSHSTQSVTFTELTDGTEYTIKVRAVDYAGNEKEQTTIATTKILNPSTDSCVGYYADIEDDGTVDGIIFADLSKGGSGIWNPAGYSSKDEWGSYIIPKEESGLKEYKKSTKTPKYSGNFGIKAVIVPVNPKDDIKKDRFYVMALTDIDGQRNKTNYYWYYAANDTGIENYKVVTSKDFGAGKENTKKMIDAWNKEPPEYGEHNKKDMWGDSTLQSKCYSTGHEGNKWFVPSIAELSAFGETFNINKSNYLSYGLSGIIWSSSLNYKNDAFFMDIINQYVYIRALKISANSRLAATF